MRVFGHRVQGILLAFGGSSWFLYACLELRHLYDVAISVPPMQRVIREMPEIRLPQIYLCPADRGNTRGFRWHSSECLLKYRDERRDCFAREQLYRGREPDEFRGKEGDSSACLEFSTHMIGVKEEWSAAWNEISLRASFVPASGSVDEDALQEIELGYNPQEWDRVGPDAGETLEKYYAALVRVPFFYLDTRTGGRSAGAGVATRMFLASEIEKDQTFAGKYWYTYSAMQIAVVNASLPAQQVLDPVKVGPLPPRLGVVHVVITLDDFQQYTFQVASAFFLFLQMLGRLCGAAALLAWTVAPPDGRAGHSADGRGPVKAEEMDVDAEEPAASPARPGAYGGDEEGQYDRAASTARSREEEEDDDEDGESKALLGGSAGAQAAAAKRGEVRPGDDASQALLGAEGTDGL